MAIKSAKIEQVTPKKLEGAPELFILESSSSPTRDLKKFSNRKKAHCGECGAIIFTALQKNNHIVQYDTPDGDAEHECDKKPMHQIHEDNFRKELLYYDMWKKAEIIAKNRREFLNEVVIKYNNRKHLIRFRSIFGVAGRDLYLCSKKRILRFSDEVGNIVFCEYVLDHKESARRHGLNVTVELRFNPNASGALEVWVECQSSCLLIATNQLKDSSVEFSYFSHDAFDVNSSDYIFSRFVSDGGHVFTSAHNRLRRRSKPYVLRIEKAR